MIPSPDLIVPTRTAFEYRGRIIIARDEYPLWRKYYLPRDQRRLQQPQEVIGKWVFHDHPERLNTLALELLPLLVAELTPLLKYRQTLNNPQLAFRSLTSSTLCLFGCG